MEPRDTSAHSQKTIFFSDLFVCQTVRQIRQENYNHLSYFLIGWSFFSSIWKLPREQTDSVGWYFCASKHFLWLWTCCCCTTYACICSICLIWRRKKCIIHRFNIKLKRSEAKKNEMRQRNRRRLVSVQDWRRLTLSITFLTSRYVK